MSNRGDWMQTYTGARFYVMDPQPEDVDPLDIAHALSLLCRYNGHVTRFYSVAEHCVLMSQAVAPEHALWALLHDATEAYVGDMIRPLKRSMPDYRAAEDRVMLAIALRFGLVDTSKALMDQEFDCRMPAEVKAADNSILITERLALLRPTGDVWQVENTHAPLPVTVTGWLPAEAEARYLARLAEVTP